MLSILSFIIILFILIFVLAILYVLKSYVNSNIAANEAILAEMKEIRKLLEKGD